MLGKLFILLVSHKLDQTRPVSPVIVDAASFTFLLNAAYRFILPNYPLVYGYTASLQRFFAKTKFSIVCHSITTIKAIWSVTKRNYPRHANLLASQHAKVIAPRRYRLKYDRLYGKRRKLMHADKTKTYK